MQVNEIQENPAIVFAKIIRQIIEKTRLVNNFEQTISEMAAYCDEEVTVRESHNN